MTAKSSSIYSLLFLLQWNWICHQNCSLAFSTLNNIGTTKKNQYINSFRRPDKVGNLSCLTIPSYFLHPIYSEKICFSSQARKNRCSLNVSSPNQHENRYVRRIISREKIHKIRGTLKKYLVTKPRTFFRKEAPGQFIPNRTEHHETHYHNIGSLAQIDTAPSFVESTVLSPQIKQVAETVTSDVKVLSQSIESFVKETATLVAEYPTQAEDIAESHERWALSAKDVDLTGFWKMIGCEDFKIKYDVYLARLGQPALVRSIAVGIVEYTTERIHHDGCEVTIHGKNLRGAWDRTLLSSGWDHSVKQYISDVDNPVRTADTETVQAESWWEDNGKVHVSWMKGVKKYGGGDFESRRYLEQNGEVLVCESTFHQNNIEQGKDKPTITWKFNRSD